MQTIRFIPDRLNAEPVVFRGFTTPELGMAALIGAGFGLLSSLPLTVIAGWVAVPTGILVMPLLLIWFGGKRLSKLKRGKPENYIWQRLEERKRHLGFGDPKMIIEKQGWSLRRSRIVKRTL